MSTIKTQTTLSTAYWRLPHDASNGDVVDNVILNFVMGERQNPTQSAASELKNVSLIEV